jgi:hypothetical protein
LYGNFGHHLQEDKDDLLGLFGTTFLWLAGMWALMMILDSCPGKVVCSVRWVLFGSVMQM